MGASRFIPKRLDPSSPSESAAILGAGVGPAAFSISAADRSRATTGVARVISSSARRASISAIVIIQAGTQQYATGETGLHAIHSH